jgi:phosphatidylserine/phosphatidylglycerophosphate/cardiolipin synthase-like enzyme
VSSSRLSHYVQVLNLGRALGASPAEIALLLEGAVAAAELVRSHQPFVEVARTGPAGGAFRLRTTGTVSREIIDSAESKILVVGYSVTGSPNYAGLASQTLASIRRAAKRGVVVTALLHRDPKNREALLASWPSASSMPSIFTWPESPSDAMTKLHAKVIVADSRDALVTSANLTYHGYEANIEIGVRVTREPARLVEAHFRELIRAGVLIAWAD